MNNTFVKLFRKLKDHEIMRDSTATHIFIWILISVDYKTGTMISGRFWASSLLGVNPNTYHKALQRLEKKYDLVTLSSNNKNTVILVKNWHKYQGDGNTTDTNKVTTKYQQSNTNQEIKEIKNIYTSNESLIFSFFNGMSDISEKAIEIAKEFDVRPKDVLFVARTMLSKESDKNVEIKNVKLKLNTYMNNAIRWHHVATLSDKKEKLPKPKVSEEDKQVIKWLQDGTIK